MVEENNAARVRIFPPGVPLAVIFIGWGLDRLWPLAYGPELSSSVRYVVGGVIVFGAVLVLGFWPVLLFRRAGQSENPWKPTSSLEQRGPFRLTRNPMYLQMMLICLGAAIAYANWWLALLTPPAAWALQRLCIEPEEVYLEAKFGDVYRRYKQRVRRWL